MFEFIRLSRVFRHTELRDGGASGGSDFEEWVSKSLNQYLWSFPDCCCAGEATDCPNCHASDSWFIWLLFTLGRSWLSQILNQCVEAGLSLRKANTSDSCRNDFLYLRVLFLEQVGAEGADHLVRDLLFGVHIAAVLRLCFITKQVQNIFDGESWVLR